MKSHFKYTYFLLSMIISISCTHTDRDNLITLEIGDPIKLDQFDEIFSDVEFLFLDSSKEALLSMPDRVEITDDRIYTYCRVSNYIYSFDLNGEMIYNTKSYHGRASNEYLVLASFTSTPTSKDLVIFDPMRRSIMKYDKYGKFLKRIKLPEECFYQNNMEIVNESKYIFTGVERELMIYDIDREELIKGSVPEGGYPHQTVGTADTRMFHRCGDELYFCPDYDKYFYAVTYDDGGISLKPIYRMQLTDNPLEAERLQGLSIQDVSEFMRGDFRSYSSFSTRSISDKYIVVSYLNDMELYYYIYNRHNGKSICFNNKFGDGEFLGSPVMVTDEYLYFYITLEHLNVTYQDYDFCQEQRDIIERGTEEANVVLLRCRFKDSLLE